MTAPLGSGARPRRPVAGDEGAQLGQRRVIILFAAAIGLILVLAAIGAIIGPGPEPPPDCQPGSECGGPPEAGASFAPVPTVAAPSPITLPPDTIGIRAGLPWTSADHGFQFEYSDLWSIDSSDGSRVDFDFQGPGDAVLIVASVAATEASPAAYADRWLGIVGEEAPDLRVDAGQRNAILGPEIGFIDGIGRTYAGTWASPQGATEPVGVSLLTASDGRTTVAVVLVVWNPDADIGSSWRQHAVRGTAELVLKTFRWGSQS
jgi:hypothetical protein